MDKANLFGNNLCQGKKDYETGGAFYGLFLPPKIKYCLSIEDFSITEEHKFLQGFNDSKRFKDCSQYFKKIEVEKVTAVLPKDWKKLFNSGVFIPEKMRFCIICNGEILCDDCSNQVTKKELEANLTLLKRQAPNEFGYMIFFQIISYMISVLKMIQESVVMNVFVKLLKN